MSDPAPKNSHDAEYQRQYRIANRERIAARKKAASDANRDELRRKARERYAANRERICAKNNAKRAASEDLRKERAAKQRAYVASNPEAVRQRGRERYAANREAILLKARHKYATNPSYRDKILEESKRYYADNIDRIRASKRDRRDDSYRTNQRLRRLANLEHVRDVSRRWRVKNRERLNEQAKARYWSRAEMICANNRARYSQDHYFRARLLASARSRYASLSDVELSAIRERARAYYDRKRSQIRAQGMKYRADNREKIRLNGRIWRLRPGHKEYKRLLYSRSKYGDFAEAHRALLHTEEVCRQQQKN